MAIFIFVLAKHYHSTAATVSVGMEPKHLAHWI